MIKNYHALKPNLCMSQTTPGRNKEDFIKMSCKKFFFCMAPSEDL